jgi:hypothetical protein
MMVTCVTDNQPYVADLRRASKAGVTAEPGGGLV